jgi:hypothetical protein
MLSAQDAIGAKNVRKVRRERHAEERDRDRAVVVVYGLTPGKEYEVELRVIGVGVQDGEVVCESPSPTLKLRYVLTISVQLYPDTSISRWRREITRQFSSFPLQSPQPE